VVVTGEKEIMKLLAIKAMRLDQVEEGYVKEINAGNAIKNCVLDLKIRNVRL
jgi:hypothetical protein